MKRNADRADRPNNTQNNLIQECRANSVLDRRFPLGYPIAVRPEIGPDVIAYFKSKHARGQCGAFYPLHKAVLVGRGES